MRINSPLKEKYAREFVEKIRAFIRQDGVPEPTKDMLSLLCELVEERKMLTETVMIRNWAPHVFMNTLKQKTELTTNRDQSSPAAIAYDTADRAYSEVVSAHKLPTWEVGNLVSGRALALVGSRMNDFLSSIGPAMKGSVSPTVATMLGILMERAYRFNTYPLKKAMASEVVTSWLTYAFDKYLEGNVTSEDMQSALTIAANAYEKASKVALTSRMERRV